MKQILEKLFSKLTLSKDEAKSVFFKLLDSRTPPSQIAAVLSALRTRQITLDELLGFREAALRDSVKINFQGLETLDVCGTGGDDKNTFNISTISAVVLAAAGVKVAKHGGGAVSSRVGSSNILEALGYKFTSDEDSLRRQIEKTGLCFLHAPLFLPAFKNVAPVRKDLGVKTIFNILGPVLNPANATFQTIGVYALDIMRLYTYLGQNLGKTFSVVHTLDGCDEISLTSDVKVSDPQKENIYSPKNFGMKGVRYDDIKEGASIEDSVKIFKEVLEGKGSEAQMNVVYANSGLSLYQMESLKGGTLSLVGAVEKVREAIKSGKAKKVFEDTLEMSRR